MYIEHLVFNVFPFLKLINWANSRKVTWNSSSLCWFTFNISNNDRRFDRSEYQGVMNHFGGSLASISPHLNLEYVQQQIPTEWRNFPECCNSLNKSVRLVSRIPLEDREAMSKNEKGRITDVKHVFNTSRDISKSCDRCHIQLVWIAHCFINLIVNEGLIHQIKSQNWFLLLVARITSCGE